MRLPPKRIFERPLHGTRLMVGSAGVLPLPSQDLEGVTSRCLWVVWTLIIWGSGFFPMNADQLEGGGEQGLPLLSQGIQHAVARCPFVCGLSPPLAAQPLLWLFW